MISLVDPKISSLEKGYDVLDDSAVRLVDMSKPILEIWEGTSEDPFKTVELNRDSRRYIHVRLNNKWKTVDKEGNIKAADKIYELVRCSEKLFKTKYE